MHSILNLALLQVIFWASSISADDPIQIETSSSSGAAGPLGCPVRSATPMNVRLHSLKTRSGKIFLRKTISKKSLQCYPYRVIPAKNIKECAEATLTTGRQMFRWKGGVCTTYSDGLPKDKICKMNDEVVVYTVGNDHNDLESFGLSLSRGFSSIGATWKKCDPDFPSRATKFQLSWNGIKISLNGSMFQHTFGKHIDLCVSELRQTNVNLRTVTLEAFDDTNTPVMEAMNKTLTESDGVLGAYLKLKSGNCLYTEAKVLNTYDEMSEYCTSIGANLFFAYADGDFDKFFADLYAAPEFTISGFYVGLRYVDGQWKWLSGIPLQKPETVVDGNGAMLPCAAAVPYHPNRLYAFDCTRKTARVCFARIP